MAEGVLCPGLLLAGRLSEVGSGVEVLHLHHLQRILQLRLLLSLNAVLLEVLLPDARVQQFLRELQRRHPLQLLAQRVVLALLS